MSIKLPGSILLAFLLLSSLFAGDEPAAARQKLFNGQFEEAAALYQQLIDRDPTASEPYYWLVRALLSAHRAKDAYAAAERAIEKAPDSAQAQTAAGMTAYRRGDMTASERHFRAALKINPNFPGALVGLSSIYSAVSKFKTASELLEKAYTILPEDPLLARAHANGLKGAEHIAALEKVLAGLDPGSEMAKQLRTHLAVDRATSGERVRRLASPYESCKVKLVLVTSGPHHVRGLGVPVKFNGKYSATLLLDTGASGISVSPKFAERAGLDSLGAVSEAKGIGDDEALIAHRYMAAEVSAGSVTFAKYPVTAFRSAKDQDIDGLIGPDVFGRFIVGIDFFHRELTLDPRPKAPPADSEDDRDADAIPVGFHRVYRFGSHLGVPTLIQEKVPRLFLMDSGASVNLIDEEAAREVTKVHKDSSTTLRGVQGKVQNVQRAENVTLVFAGFRQENSGLIAINMDKMNESHGVAFGGILGMPVLSNFKLSIDYVNGAIKMDYLGPK